MQNCGKPTDLKGMEQALEDDSKMIYWDEISYEIDQLCLQIANCPNRCDNATCKALQGSKEVLVAFEEEMADRSVVDTLPDDEFY